MSFFGDRLNQMVATLNGRASSEIRLRDVPLKRGCAFRSPFVWQTACG